MARAKLESGSVEKLSGGFVGKLLDKGMVNIFEDIKDRGEDRQVRTLTLTLTFKPDGHGYVKVLPKVAVKLPALVPPETVARVDLALNGLVFSPESAENPDQKTFADKLHDGEIEA